MRCFGRRLEVLLGIVEIFTAKRDVVAWVLSIPILWMKNESFAPLPGECARAIRGE